MSIDYELRHDEIKKITSPDIARAGPLGPCIGIGIYDEISKSGYICFSYPGSTKLIRQTLDEALRDFQDSKKLKIGIAGANKSLINEKFKSFEKEVDRLSNNTWDELEQLVKSYDFEPRKVKLYREKIRGKVQDLYLNCDKGRVEVTSTNERAFLNKYL